MHDRSVVPGAAVKEYPSGLVAEIAGRIPLLQNGRRFVRDPIVIDTEEVMRGFLNWLEDPARDMPFAVASIPPDEPDMDLLADQWAALARALAGLAVVWVLAGGDDLPAERHGREAAVGIHGFVAVLPPRIQ